MAPEKGRLRKKEGLIRGTRVLTSIHTKLTIPAAAKKNHTGIWGEVQRVCAPRLNAMRMEG